jgi:hypothetical protein
MAVTTGSVLLVTGVSLLAVFGAAALVVIIVLSLLKRRRRITFASKPAAMYDAMLEEESEL